MHVKTTLLALGGLCALASGCASTGRYSAAALDRDMVHVPGGEFLYGMTEEELEKELND